MALVLSPWFGRAGCGRRTRFNFGGPSLFTDLVILKVPLQRPTCAPVSSSRAMANAGVVQWAETADEHIFKLRLPGLKKKDMHIQIEDDRLLYISYNNKLPKEDSAKEAESAKSGSCSFMRKFKLPENADLEHIKAEVTNETLTVIVPKRKTKSPEVRKIDVSEGESKAAAISHESKQPSSSTANQPSTLNAKSLFRLP